MDDQDIRKLITALIKSGTTAPRVLSSVIPIEPFQKLLKEWPENDLLSTKQLRMKSLTLLAFVLMLRPSDVAPNAQYYNPILDSGERHIFTTDHLTFNQDGSLSVIFHGIKNDYDRDGYKVNVPCASDNKLDPVGALKVYVDKTHDLRGQNGPVFLSLTLQTNYQ